MGHCHILSSKKFELGIIFIFSFVTFHISLYFRNIQYCIFIIVPTDVKIWYCRPGSYKFMILLNLIYFSYSEHLKGSLKNIMIFLAILPVNFDSASQFGS